MKQNTKRELKPKLRFPEFWEAGEWAQKLLGEIGGIVTGKTPSTTDESLWNGDIQFVTPTDITEEKYQWKTQRSVVNNRKIKIIPKYSTMFTCIASIGKMSLSVHPCITNQQINTIIPNNNYENEFVYYSLLNIVPFIKATQSNTTLPIINKTEFSKFTLPIPSTVPEQQKIADCLSSIDELITAQTQKLDKLKVHKKGLMQQLFPDEGETLPRLRFPEFWEAGEWDICRLDSKVTKVGSGITPKGGEINYKKEGRPFIRSQNIGWSNLILDDVVFIDEDTHSTFLATEIKEKDVLLNITGASIGRSAVADAKIHGGNVNQHVCIIRVVDSELNPEILNYYLLSQYGQKQIDSFQAGGNRQGLNFAQVRSFLIPLPPKKDEQQKIADCLSSLDELITAQTQELVKLKAHKKGLMQQLFPSAEP